MSELAVAADVRISLATDTADIETARGLFLEYARSLGFSLCFQGFDEELATLPGSYAPPQGRLEIARVDGNVAGCVGLRPLDGDRCEMKRLYVRPAFRGHGLGRRLAEFAIAEARTIGYQHMVLDTLESMTAARALYASFGFREIPAYYNNPLDGVIYAELLLVG
jgi:ribosomal protein S18 acetylase RimI-like enzyme